MRGDPATPRVLVTGAGGFVGGAVLRTFAAAGWQVTGVVRSRVPALAEAANVEFVSTDLRQSSGLPARYDYLIHCAADVPAKVPDADEMVRSNVEGTRELLRHAEGAGARGVVYMSSMSAFGRITVPVVDEDTPAGERDDYGRSKAEGESLLADWVRRSGGEGVSIRLPGIVGAGGRNNFLCDTLQRIMLGQPVTARNPDALFNNVVHAGDLAGFSLALCAGAMTTGHAILTIAADEPLTLRETLALLFRCAGRAERITWAEPGGNPFRITFTRARALGYRPATVRESVARFVADELATVLRA